MQNYCILKGVLIQNKLHYADHPCLLSKRYEKNIRSGKHAWLNVRSKVLFDRRISWTKGYVYNLSYVQSRFGSMHGTVA